MLKKAVGISGAQHHIGRTFRSPESEKLLNRKYESVFYGEREPVQILYKINFFVQNGNSKPTKQGEQRLIPSWHILKSELLLFGSIKKGRVLGQTGCLVRPDVLIFGMYGLFIRHLRVVWCGGQA